MKKLRQGPKGCNIFEISRTNIFEIRNSKLIKIKMGKIVPNFNFKCILGPFFYGSLFSFVFYVQPGRLVVATKVDRLSAREVEVALL